MTAQIVPLPSTNQWRDELLENFNNQLDKLQILNSAKIEDITNSIFNLKSELLGNITLGLIKKDYNCTCPPVSRGAGKNYVGLPAGRTCSA